MTRATLSIAFLSLFGNLPRDLELFLLVLGVSVLGLPHGSLDYVSGRLVFRARFGALWLVAFGISYLALMALAVAGWLVAPPVALVGFLVLSAAHFGMGDVQPELALGAGTSLAQVGLALEATARGALMTVTLLHMHPEAISQLFASLVPASAESLHTVVATLSPRLTVVTGALVTVVMAHHLGGWAQGRVEHGRVSLEIASLTVLFCLATPLLAFIVYFCGWHSFRHSVRQAAELDPSSAKAGFSSFLRHAWPTTLAAVVLGAAGYFAFGSEVPAEGILWVVFVGLSALTVPHVFFSWLAERSHAGAIRCQNG